MIRSVPVVLVFLLVAFQLEAQSVFQRILPGSYGTARSAMAADDGDVVVAGDDLVQPPFAQVMRYNGAGDALQWSLRLHLLGEPDNGLLSITDACQSADGGAYVTGKLSTSFTTDTGYVARISPTGTLDWARISAFTFPGFVGWSDGRVREAPNGDIVLMASFDTDVGQTREEVALSRFTASGEPLWSRRISSPALFGSDRPAALDIKTDGTITIVGQNFYSDDGSWLMSFGPQGNLLWEHQYDTQSQIVSRTPIALSSTDIGFGILFSTGSTDVLTQLVIDTEGAVLGALQYANTGNRFEAANAIRVPGLGWYVIGKYWDDLNLNRTDAALVHLLEDGSVDWAKKFGGIGREQGLACARTADGGILLVGDGQMDHSTNTPGGITTSMYLVKCQSSGFSTGCEAYFVVDMAIASYAASAIDHVIEEVEGWEELQLGVSDDYSQIPVCTGVGMDEPFLENALLYPNPANELINVDATPSETVTVWDVHGHMISLLMVRDANKVSADVSSLAGGVYFIRVTSKGSSRAQRFVRTDTP